MNIVSKNAYTDKVGNIVDKYNNKYHRTIKMKHTILRQVDILTLMLKIMIKILNLRLVIMRENQNIKHFCRPIGIEET